MTKISERTRTQLDKLKVGDLNQYFAVLNEVVQKTEVTFKNPPDGGIVSGDLHLANLHLSSILEESIQIKKNRLMIVGNGGSAAIAVHMLMDFVNAGNIRTMDFTSPALLTCMANDYGYENVFAKPIEKFAEPGDVLFAISSSGSSKNILKACGAALNKSCTVITFSGMDPENPLRSMGSINFYVPSSHYGFIELTHEIILHGILDLFVGSH